MPPLLVTRKAPPADEMFPKIDAGPGEKVAFGAGFPDREAPLLVTFRFSSVLVWPVAAAPNWISPAMPPVAVEASVTRLPPPSEMAMLPAGAPPLLIAPSLLTTLWLPAERIGAGAARVPPVTFTPGRTLIVSRLNDDWKPLVSAVEQVTVVLVALMRQSASAGVGNMIPKPVSAVPSFRPCFAEKRVSILLTPVKVAEPTFPSCSA